jgi:sulfotransferase 6B1
MFQILTGLPSITFDGRNHLHEGVLHQLPQHLNALTSIKENEFLSGHIYYSKEWETMLNNLMMKQVFLIRDLRDIIVSYNHYAEKTNSALFQYFAKNNFSQKERLMTIINGLIVDEIQHSGINDWFNSFIGWMRAENVFLVRFEDLIISEKKQTETLTKLIHFLYEDHPLPLPLNKMITGIKKNINPSQSGTFRKGKIGNWREEFDQEIKQAFKEAAGDLLIQLNYEKNNKW